MLMFPQEDKDPATPPERERSTEMARQARLIEALWQGEVPVGLPGLQAVGQARGWVAYRAHAQAAAARALTARYPTVAALLGEAPMAAFAWALWRAHPPVSGDLAQWGDALPAFLFEDARLQGEPYLCDCARLDALVAQAECAPDFAADSEVAPDSLALLGTHDPFELTLELAPGAALLASRFPIVRIWQAHHLAAAIPAGSDADLAAQRFAAARAALQAGEGDVAWVWRAGWRVQVETWPGSAADTRCLRALLAGASLGQALDAAMTPSAAAPSADTEAQVFDFGRWLATGLHEGWVLGARLIAH